MAKKKKKMTETGRLQYDLIITKNDEKHPPLGQRKVSRMKVAGLYTTNYSSISGTHTAHLALPGVTLEKKAKNKNSKHY